MRDWRKVIMKQSNTMEEAIEVLDREALRIVMVVDESDRLVGTITDGDVRRGLLRHLGMNSKLHEFMFREPTVVTADEQREDILNKIQSLDLLQAPVVDQDRRVIGLETQQHLLKKKRYDNPVFLMAGGFGKRLRPLTDHTPKPLLSVGGKPILETIIKQFIQAGYHRFYISTHYKAKMVRDHFGDGSNWDVTIEYVHEDEPLGTAGALGLLPDSLPDLPILMMNGDLLTKVDFEELLDFHIENKGDATMCVREYDFQIPYGVIKAKNHHILSIEEKPIHSFFVNAGIYVLNPSMLQEVDGVSYLDMPHLLEKKIDSSGQVNMFPVHEYWLDIGQMKQFDQAHRDIDKIIL
jgi:dTDP-glucose pyrophosphorylase